MKASVGMVESNQSTLGSPPPLADSSRAEGGQSVPRTPPEQGEGGHAPSTCVVLFDGECGFCRAWVRWVVQRDRSAQFRFASLQSAVGRRLLGERGLEGEALRTVVLVEKDGAWTRSEAVLRIAGRLAWPWRYFHWLRGVPRGWRDALYEIIARHRHRWRSASSVCPLRSPEMRQRFLDEAH